MSTEGILNSSIAPQAPSPQGQPEPTPLEAAYIRLVNSYKALQQDYHDVGFINPTVWGNSCRALHEAEKNLVETLLKLRAGDTADDFHKHRGNED
jgi:hypothetical protein